MALDLLNEISVVYLQFQPLQVRVWQKKKTLEWRRNSRGSQLWGGLIRYHVVIYIFKAQQKRTNAISHHRWIFFLYGAKCDTIGTALYLTNNVVYWKVADVNFSFACLIKFIFLFIVWLKVSPERADLWSSQFFSRTHDSSFL